MLTQAYFALLHVATTPAVRPASHTLEVSRRQLAALSLEDSPSLPPGESHVTLFVEDKETS